MRSEYQAHNDLRVSKQEVIRSKNLAYLEREAKEKRQRNEQRVSKFCKAAFWIFVGLMLAIVLKQLGIWL